MWPQQQSPHFDNNGGFNNTYYPTNTLQPQQRDERPKPKQQHDYQPWYQKYTDWATDSKPITYTMQHPFIVTSILVSVIVAIIGTYYFTQSRKKEAEVVLKRKILLKKQALASSRNPKSPILHVAIVVPPNFTGDDNGGGELDDHSKVAQTLCDLFSYAAQSDALRVAVMCFEKVAIVEDEFDNPNARDVRRVYQYMCKQIAFPSMSEPQLRFVAHPIDEWFGPYKAYADLLVNIKKTALLGDYTLRPQFVLIVHRGFRPVKHYDKLLFGQWRQSYEQLVVVSPRHDNKNFMANALQAQDAWYEANFDALQNNRHLPLLTQPIPFVADVKQLQSVWMTRGVDDTKQSSSIRTFDEVGLSDVLRVGGGSGNDKTQYSKRDWRYVGKRRQCWPGTFEIKSPHQLCNERHVPLRVLKNTPVHANFFDIPIANLTVMSALTPQHTPWINFNCLFGPASILLDTTDPNGLFTLWNNSGNFNPMGANPIALLTACKLWCNNKTVLGNPTVLIGAIDDVYHSLTDNDYKPAVSLWQTDEKRRVLPHAGKFIKQQLSSIVNSGGNQRRHADEFEHYYGLHGILTLPVSTSYRPSEQAILGVSRPVSRHMSVMSSSISQTNSTTDIALKYKHDQRYQRQMRLIRRILQTLENNQESIDNSLAFDNDNLLEDIDNGDILLQLNDSYILVLGDTI